MPVAHLPTAQSAQSAQSFSYSAGLREEFCRDGWVKHASEHRASAETLCPLCRLYLRAGKVVMPHHHQRPACAPSRWGHETRRAGHRLTQQPRTPTMQPKPSRDLQPEEPRKVRTKTRATAAPPPEAKAVTSPPSKPPSAAAYELPAGRP